MKLPKTTRKIIFAIFVAYVANALLIAGTEQLLARAFSDTKYFVADVVTQSVTQVGCGYLCSLISNARPWPAIVGLISIGLLVAGFSLAASWHADPHWYGIALILVYAPCVWMGYRMERRQTT
jgi:hypothetical protein